MENPLTANAGQNIYVRNKMSYQNEQEAVVRGKVETAKREKLKREKPEVFEKILTIKERQEKKIPTPLIDIAYDYRCNLRCRHCAANCMTPKENKLTPAVLRRLSEEADALGLCQFVVSGGEPLLFPDLPEVMEALQPNRFHIAMSTNGHFMTPEKAVELKKMGLDKVKISLDDFDPELHDQNRGKSGAFEKALNALKYCKDADLAATIQAVVTHQNCRTDRTVKMAKFAQEMGYNLDIIIARAIGQWEGKHEVLIDREDADFLWQLHQEYPCLHRDTFPAFGMHVGCGCVKALLHITPYGDVFPCVFIHVSIGNIFEESLADIIKRGNSIKWFSCHSPICLSGENRYFIENYMSKFYGKPLPVSWKDVFTEKDFIQ